MGRWRRVGLVSCFAGRLAFGGLALVALAGCGEDEGPSAEPGVEQGAEREGAHDAAWSAPADAPANTASGSPDGGDAAENDTSAAGLLRALRARVAEGRGMADAGYEREVRDVAEVLWPADGSPEERSGAQVHMQVAAIAAQVGGWLAESESAGLERTKSDPVDLKIHAAFLRAAGAGPKVYRAWCEVEGAALLKELAAARRARFFPKR